VNINEPIVNTVNAIGLTKVYKIIDSKSNVADIKSTENINTNGDNSSLINLIFLTYSFFI